MFLARGYAATTIDAIAAAARVSRRTVFNSVGGKVVLLRLAMEWAIVGDDEPVALAERPGVRAILAEPDPRRALALWAQMVVEVASRVAPVSEVLTAAADADPGGVQVFGPWPAAGWQARPSSSGTSRPWTAWPPVSASSRRPTSAGP